MFERQAFIVRTGKGEVDLRAADAATAIPVDDLLNEVDDLDLDLVITPTRLVDAVSPCPITNFNPLQAISELPCNLETGIVRGHHVIRPASSGRRCRRPWPCY